MQRTLRLGLVLVAVCWSVTPPLPAGVYNGAEPLMAPAADFRQFKTALADLRGLTNDQQETPLRKQYQSRALELEARLRRQVIRADERVSLSFYWIYLLQPQKAIEVLTPFTRQEPPDPLALANLATAYHLAGQADRAIHTQGLVLKYWPKLWPGWTTAELDRLRRAEVFFLDLLQRRRQTQVRARPGSGLQLDELFAGVRFVDERGDYSAGEIAANQRAALPPDALAVVEQLLLWLPQDVGLAWLLAEVLNAQGNVIEAAQIMNDLLFIQRVESPELRRHRAVLNEARGMVGQVGPWLREGQLLWWLAPRGDTLATPVGGLLLQEAAWVALLKELGREPTPTLTRTEVPPAAPAPREEAGDWMPSPFRAAVVGFMAGVVIGLLCLVQYQEFRRRLRAPRRER